MSNVFRLENNFDVSFTAALATREKQIQQSYRPIIGVHKWFARRPGTVFRNLLLAEFNGEEPISVDYWKAHSFQGVIADPFMGGGTPIYEANRLGFSVIGTDINPMAFWIVHQSLSDFDEKMFRDALESVVVDVDREIKDLYTTRCTECNRDAPVKYFIWVKTQDCPSCGEVNDLFPGHLLAEDVRHPKNVLVCNCCGALNGFERTPTKESPGICRECGSVISVEGHAKRNKISCKHCSIQFGYPARNAEMPPRHRMWAIEYHCDCGAAERKGRFFKAPDQDDLNKYQRSLELLADRRDDLPIPDDDIPLGDETKRLHRWGYKKFREMFNDRQLLSLGILLRRIMIVPHVATRHALLTVFSDFIRYQNMLCRYDTYALKCQDIFSVHGFPVGLVQCENNVIGIPKVGSGAFVHFAEKFVRAKLYCKAPFETRVENGKKRLVPIVGETIAAVFTGRVPSPIGREACIAAMPATEIPLPPQSLDGVFTDPPYFDNVQYAELMDFCYSWLRQALASELACFQPSTTRAHAELTGNETMGRGLEHFTEGLSKVFCHYASALKPNAPFVFTYHHNDPLAYLPLVVAMLDAGLNCTAALPAPAEMAASLHIAGSNSSVLDTVFVCRAVESVTAIPLKTCLVKDVEGLQNAGLSLTAGDLRCLIAGHVARLAVNELMQKWGKQESLQERTRRAADAISRFSSHNPAANLIEEILSRTTSTT